MSQITTQNKFVRTLQLFGQAVRGQQQYYTTGSLRKAIFLLAIPMIIEMGMESVLALVDLFFVGRLGKHAVSTVGLTESVLTLIYSIAVGLRAWLLLPPLQGASAKKTKTARHRPPCKASGLALR